MTHEEYIRLLMEVKDADIEQEEKIERLDELHQIKPVSLVWNVLKAEVLLENAGDLSEEYNLLNGFFNMDCKSEGNIEACGVLHRLDDIAGDVEMGRYREFEIAQCMENEDFLEKRLEQEKIAEQRFLNEGDVAGLFHEYLSDCKLVSYYILEKYRIFLQPEQGIYRPWVENIPNFGFLKEAIDKRKDVIVCVGSEKEYAELSILGLVLARMGCKVFIVNVPIPIEVDVPPALRDTVAICIDNISIENEMTIIPAVELICEGKSLGNNAAEIVRSLSMEDVQPKNCLLLASSSYMEQLARTDALKRNLQNLFIQTSKWKKENISFGWTGDYLSYIGEIYGMDAEAAIHREPKCRFSIVVPARNSSATLRHTLKTCLNQRYQGSYEIIISDNSSNGNAAVYNMVQEMQDRRIKYFRTPRELHLPKSFEYAFLQATGEYIFSIGSDDALLPWTLEVLDDVVGRYPDEEVIRWERGFYAWPGFNGGQENQFVIPGRYQKGQYQEIFVSTISFLTDALKNPPYMYAMPLLYINSMFKRSYFDTLLEHTGRLWDGVCQDLYMGVVTSLIVPRILCLQYPLSIAGMSSGSVGATSNAAIVDADEGIKWHQDINATCNIGAFAMSYTEMLFPEVTTDVSSLYNCVLKAVARGLLPEHILWEEDGIDWKAWFLNCYRTLDKQDIYFCAKLQVFRIAAMKHGEAFLKWFDETIYREALEPVIFEKRDNMAKMYQEYDDERGIMLDASKQGVYNVYEASLLFEKLTGL